MSRQGSPCGSGRPELVVVGGGAAGFFAAIAAAEVDPGARVTILEAGAEPLVKVRISGGGRCNVTHHCFDPARLVEGYPRGGRELRSAFARFQPRDTVAWFEGRGVALEAEPDGRMFPVTNDSATIVECFLAAARDAGVLLRTRSPVREVVRQGPGFEVTLKDKETLCADRVLLATGGGPAGHRLACSLGHGLVAPVPSLFTFNVDDPALHLRMGLAAEGSLSLFVEGRKRPFVQAGPVLITHWGLSGPAVLKLSAWGARALNEQGYRARLEVNWLPGLRPEEVRLALTALKAREGRRSISHADALPIPRRLWQYLLERRGIDPDQIWAGLPRDALNQMVEELTVCRFEISGKGVFKEEFVTSGGVPLPEVDFTRMESRPCPGLHLAGEILDIDGITGGYNFQSAWTTGWIAAHAMAGKPL